MKIDYKFSIQNYDEDGADFIGAMTIQILGQDAETKEIQLGKTFIQRGHKRIYYFNAELVANVIGARLKAIGKGNFKCLEASLQTGMKSWLLDCPIIEFEDKEAKETLLELSISGNQIYNVFVKTSSLQREAFRGQVFISFIGDKGQTGRKIFARYGFEPGKMEKIQIIAQDLGELTGISLESKSRKEWLPESIEIKKGEGGSSILFDLAGKTIKCPPACKLEIDQKKEEKKCVKDEDLVISEKTLERTFMGEALTPTEQSKIVRLKCKDTVKSHPKFQMNFPAKIINPVTMIAICPPGCTEVKKLKVYGDYVHPEESSICGAAYTDKAMSALGGVIGVSVFNGMDYYGIEIKDDKMKNKVNAETEENEASKKEVIVLESDQSDDGTEIEKKIFGNSKKSFFVYKIDNLDMVGNTIRIVNAMGGLSDFGRLEFRAPGTRDWGTVCAMNTNSTTGKVACDSLGYYGGEVKNPDNERGMGFCENVNEVNFCGKKGVKNLISEVNCKGGEKTEFLGCGNYNQTEIKNICPDHRFDLVVECFTFDRSNLIKPPPGTIRLVNSKNQPSSNGIGRLELYFDAWGSVCSKDFDEVSAKVACKQMGFLNGKYIKECTNVNGENLCAADDKPIVARSVICKGSEEKVEKCQITYNSEGCLHSNDVVLECAGGESDPSGVTQIMKSITRFAEAKISKDYPVKELDPTCDRNMENDKSAIGDLLIINCPQNCHRLPGILFGYFVYEQSSPICKAAYHSGLITDIGGKVMVVKLGKMSYFDSFDAHGYKSSKYLQESYGYGLTKVNSLAEKFLAIKKAKAEKFLFLQLDQTIFRNPHSDMAKFNFFKNFRFNQLADPVEFFKKNPPSFAWAPNYKGFMFQGCFGIYTKEYPNADGASAEKDFTIMMKIKLGKKLTRNQFILGNTESCISLYLNSKNILVLAKMSPFVEFNTEYVLGKSEKTVTFKYAYAENHISFYVNDKMTIEQNLVFNFKCPADNMVIGGQLSGNYHFVGEIKYFQMWKFPLVDNLLMHAVSVGLIEPEKAKVIREYSKNGEPCVTPCRDAPLPGEEFAPSPPLYARDGLPYYGTRVDEPSRIEGMPDVAPSSEYFLQPNVLSCDDQATKGIFQASFNTSFLVRCPKDCHQDKSSVFGTLIYPEVSSICKAGIHSGFIEKYAGGEFYIVIVPGEESYQGSLLNGILSLDYSGSMRSFKLKTFSNIKKISCDISALEDQFNGDENSRFTVYCRPGCKLEPPVVYGIGPFSGDSSICQAAIFAGAIDDGGGAVTFKIQEGRAVFPSGFSHNIRSSDRIGTSKSFSFDNNNTCHYYAESLNNFNQENFLQLGKAVWDVVPNPYSLGKILAILNYKGAGNEIPGALLLRRSFHCSDGLLKFKFSRKGDTVYAVLRYWDSKNYLSVQIDGDKVKIVHIDDGSSKFSAEGKYKFSSLLWYRVAIIFFDKNIEVYIGEGNNEEFKLVLAGVLETVKAGYGGVGASGKVFFQEIRFETFHKGKKFIDFIVPENPYQECLNFGNYIDLQTRCKAIIATTKVYSDIKTCNNPEANCVNCCNSLTTNKEKVKKCIIECVKEFPVKSQQLMKIQSKME